ncbi:two pore domain potassium channel family protein [Glaciecola sp. MH2013]|uniref:potassium channel family protein n=1 Tax=Glaciecola sp. MH2013 TaxID=2785524 RepID=UPI00189F1883|nr:potassium channel family protein [Glaciecola sp. MH2013]MBF7074813.1 two pore domain potassium channel family protein [Glaciecola sp. MH2013]
MLHWVKLKKLCMKYFSEMRWYTLLLALAFYSVSTWLMLYLADEDGLLQINDFLYWLVVTGSTVGYGDMSPASDAGKLIVALYVIPVGLSIFALVVGRIASWVSYQWKRGARGLKPLNVSNHILIIGWNEKRTDQLLKLLLKEKQDTPDNPDIVLCVRAEIENPRPSEIEFVRVSSFNKDEDMDMACIESASTILIDNPYDDVTMTTALYCSKRNPTAHKVAYFEDEGLVSLLQKHCPEVECTPSVAVEMLAKSAFDPGSSLLHHDLLDVEEGQAQFSVDLPIDTKNLSVEALFIGLKKRYNATFIGFAAADNANKITVNPDFGDEVHPGDKIFYIAVQRINNVDWNEFHS